MEEAKYAEKLNKTLTEAYQKWWNDLTKEEILSYLLHQESITADLLRKMLSDEACVLNLTTTFAVNQLTATTDFNLGN